MSDCIIIGAGLAALTAARHLTAQGRSVVLLEARNRLGGRASTKTVNGLKVDTGCSMIHGHLGGNPLTALAESARVPVHVAAQSVPLILGPDGPLTAADASSLLAASAQAAKPNSKLGADISLAQFTLPNLSSPSLVALARTAEVGAGVTLEELSAKWSGFGRGFPGADGFPQGGYVSLVDKLASEIEAAGGTIKLSTEVTAVEDLGAGEGVRVTVRGGETHSAKTILSTIPLGVLQQLDDNFFTPPLSAPLAAAIERVTVGALEKVILSYDKPWWPSPELHGTYILLPTITDGSKPTSLSALFARTTFPVLNFYQAGAQPGVHATLLVYVGANAAKFIASYDAAEVSKAMHTYIAKRLGVEAPEPVASEVTSWFSDPWSRGATSAPTTLAKSQDGEQTSPLDLMLLGRSEWEGRLGFAGEATEIDTRGSAGGAVVSGEREGRRLAELLSRI